MAALASAVGMTKSGLYAHFKSKEELQLATIEQVCEVFAEKVLHGPPDDPAPGLAALLERWLSFFEHKVFPRRMLFSSSPRWSSQTAEEPSTMR